MIYDISFWAVSIILVSLPYAWLLVVLSRYGNDANDPFSEGDDPLNSFWVGYLVVVIIGVSYVACVALVAFWLRMVLAWFASG